MKTSERGTKKPYMGGHPHTAEKGNVRHRKAFPNVIPSRYFTLFMVLILFLGITACRANGGDAAAIPPPTDAPAEPTEETVETVAEEPTAEVAQTAETRTITDALGREVTIPANPQRVVVLSEIDLDSLLALGIVPVGAPNGRGQMTLPSYLLPLIEGKTTSIGGLGEPNLETILTLQPDVIVYSDPYGPLAEKIPDLEQIAPVVVPYVDNGDWHWKTVFLAVAEAMDKSAEAEAWMQMYEADAAALGTYLSNDLREVSIVRWMADGPRILLSNAFSSQVLSDIGFVRPDYQLDLAGTHPVHTDVISLEEVNLVDADIVFAGGLNPEGDVAMQEALQNPLVQTLTSVQTNRLFLVDGLAWSSTGGPTAAMQVLADVEKALNQIAETPIVNATVSPLPRTITDMDDNEIVIEDDSRIIALEGPVTEIVYALGAGDRLIATDVSSTYPEAATQLPQVGYVRQLSAEPILALDPTLIITTDQAGPPEVVAQLRESGVPIAMFASASSIEESYALIRNIAQTLGLVTEGESLIAQMEADLAEAAALLAQVETTPRVLFIYARGVDTVMGGGLGTGVDVILAMAGAENAVTEFEGYQPLTAEAAVAAAPDAYLLFTSGLESVGGTEGLLQIPGLAQTPAGESERVFAMDGLLLTGFGPRVGQAIIELIYLLHPELP